MIYDFFILIVGAIIGAFLGIVFPIWQSSLSSWLSSRRIRDRRSFLNDNKKNNKWIINYYKMNGHQDDLFDCKIGSFEMKIPFITKKEWILRSPINPKDNILLYYAETEDHNFLVDEKVIEKRKKLGQNLFNDPTLYLDRIELSDGLIQLHVKDCDYFKVATSLIKLEEETFSAIRKDKVTNLAIRDKYFPNLDTINKLLLKPFSIGCSVALVLKIKQSYELILHTRSHSTICAGGLKTAIPNFGLVPFIGGAKKLILQRNTRENLLSNNDYNLIYFNFIKEYLEELFNYEDLIKSIDSSKANPFWFYDLPEARLLIELIDNKKFILEFLGLGFEAVNGTAMLNFLGIIDDEKTSIDLKEALRLNWEVSRKDGMIEIDFVDINSPDLELWLREGCFTASGAFTISRSIQAVKEKMGSI